jgi:hypothetical protein
VLRSLERFDVCEPPPRSPRRISNTNGDRRVLVHVTRWRCLLTDQPYLIPDSASRVLDAMVDGIERKPGRMIRPGEFDELAARVGTTEVLHSLPEGMSDDDFAGILKLALLTESATDSYGSVFEDSAREHNAGWLARFNRDVWVPDELTHHAPFKLMLLGLGFSEEQLDREIREAQEVDYIHRGGTTPVHLTTFGVVQEYLTDNWHGLVARLMKGAAPEAAYMANRIKQRETLHTVWYRDMTALQLEANPQLLPSVAESLIKFEMPGNTVAPAQQARAQEWLPMLGANFERITRDIVKLLYEIAGNTRTSGELVMEIAAQKGVSLGPLSARHLQGGLNRLGGPGYGLLGEAMLERSGLGHLFRTPPGRQDPAMALYTGPYERVRGLVRSWVAKQLDLGLQGA